MKTFQLLFITLLLGISFSACSKDDNNNDTNAFDKNFLKQTKWSGMFISSVDGIESQHNVVIYFTTDSRGNYDFPEDIVHNIEFNYIVDGNLLSIGGVNLSPMNGDWMLIDMNKDKLSFKKGLASSSKYYNLELSKIEN